MTNIHSKFNPHAAGKSGKTTSTTAFSALVIVISPWAIWITAVQGAKPYETSRIPAAIGDAALFLQALNRAAASAKPQVIFSFAGDDPQLTQFGKAACETVLAFADLAHIPCIALPDQATITQPGEGENEHARRWHFGGRSLDFLAWKARIERTHRPPQVRQRRETPDESNFLV